MLFEEISISPLSTTDTKNNFNSNDFHITSTGNYIQQVIDKIQANVPGDELHIIVLKFVDLNLLTANLKTV